jgi:tetratricopeptide (TPR) repeat protein
MADSYYEMGNYDKYVESEERVLQIERQPEVAAELKQAYATGGIKRVFRWFIARDSDPSRPAYSPLTVADSYALLGDRDNAFVWLEKAYQQHASGLLGLPVNPAFDSLHSDPRYADLIRRIGFPQ